MIKQYSTPEIKVININASEIISTSTGFGNGETSVMHTRGQGGAFEEDYDLIDN